MDVGSNPVAVTYSPAYQYILKVVFQDYHFKLLLENKLFTEKNGILIKEREQPAIVGHTLLEKRALKVYILYKPEYSNECIYITKYFLLIFLCKCNTFQKMWKFSSRILGKIKRM